jgi:hypothetical protein
MAHVHCMLDTKGYRHTLTICNTYCFSIATLVYERSSVLPYTYIAALLNNEDKLYIFSDRK